MKRILVLFALVALFATGFALPTNSASASAPATGCEAAFSVQFGGNPLTTVYTRAFDYFDWTGAHRILSIDAGGGLYTALATNPSAKTLVNKVDFKTWNGSNRSARPQLVSLNWQLSSGMVVPEIRVMGWLNGRMEVGLIYACPTGTPVTPDMLIPWAQSEV